jgi:hypothetical protein
VLSQHEYHIAYLHVMDVFDRFQSSDVFRNCKRVCVPGKKLFSYMLLPG